MQERIPSSDLREQLARLDSKISRYENDLEANLADEHRATAIQGLLAGAVALRERVRDRLAKNELAEAAEKKRLAEVAGADRMAELAAEHAAMCSDLQRDIDSAAAGLENLLLDVSATRKALAELSNEYDSLYLKAHGVYPNHITQGLHRVGVIPGDVQPLPDASRLYRHLYSLLAGALGSGLHVVFEQARLESVRFKPGEPINAQAIDESGMSPGEVMAARRSGLGR